METKNPNPVAENINNTMPQQEAIPPSVNEKPKKNNYIIVAVIALLLLVVPGTIMYFVLNGEAEKNLEDSDKVLQQLQADKDLQKVEDDMHVEEEINNLEIYTQELKRIKEDCILDSETRSLSGRRVEVSFQAIKATISTMEEIEGGQYEGFLWITVIQDEVAELIKNYSTINVEVDRENAELDNVQEYFEVCIDNISEYLLSENFTKNDFNSFDNTVEGHSINRNIAFEKDDIKLRLEHLGWELNTYLGDIKNADTPEVFQEIYRYVDTEKDFTFDLTLHNVHNDFALLTIAGGITAWDTIWERKASGEWEQSITLYQYLHPCEEFVDANIPPELFENAPSSFEEGRSKECVDENNESFRYEEYVRSR